MKRIAFFLLAATTLVNVVAFTASAARRADESTAPLFVTKIPPGYRDWKVVSVAHEAGDLNDIRAVLGNDIAIKAYRSGKLTPEDIPLIIFLIGWVHVVADRRRGLEPTAHCGNSTLACAKLFPTLTQRSIGRSPMETESRRTRRTVNGTGEA